MRVHRDWCFDAFVDVKIPGAEDDLLSSAAGKSRYVQLKGFVENSWSHVPWTAGQGLFCFFSVRTCSIICPFRVSGMGKRK